MVVTRGQRRRVTWNGVESDQSVFTDILSRLSVRCILKFRTMNKYWNGSISNRHFVAKQLSQSRKKPSYISCPSMDRTMELYLLQPGSFNFGHLATVDPAGRNVEDDMYMIASFNGLVCCINGLFVGYEDHFDDLQIWICNPSTEETLLLPQGRPSFGTEPAIGVAYGPEISEYKVFRIFCAGEKNPGEMAFRGNYDGEDGEDEESIEAFLYECEVYSSSTGAWRNIGTVPHLPEAVCLRPHRSSHVFARGKIYWLVSLEAPGKILSVDMEERFQVMELPPYSEELAEEDGITEATYLINLGGSLSVVILHSDYMDIWVWNEDCKQPHWELEIVDEFPFENDEIVLFVNSSEKEMLLATGTKLWTYDLDTGDWNDRGTPPTEFVAPAMFPFTESLLPCNGW